MWSTRALACLGALASLFVPSYAAIDPRAAERVEPVELAPPPVDAPAKAPDDVAPPGALARLVNIHTGESAWLSDKEPTPQRMSELVSDRITGETIGVEPKLLGVLRALASKRAVVRIELVSGYRSPKLNEMLRKKERRVASHSQHSLGHALDFRVEGMTPKEMRREVEALGWKGGIGQYDKPEDRFIHVDVGPDRRWKGK